MSMMYEAPFMIALMTFLVVITAGAFLGLRVYGRKQVHQDHPVQQRTTPRTETQGKSPGPETPAIDR